MQNSADRFPWDLLIPIIPQLLALLVVAAVVILIGPRRIASLLGRIRKIGFAGLQIELKDLVEDAAEHRNAGTTTPEADRAARRLAEAAALLSCTRLLWVDDLPSGNVREIKTLRRLCVAIDLAQTHGQAEAALESGVYDLVISDMTRGVDGEAGMAMVAAILKSPFRPALIYYVGLQRPLPEGAFGITTRPDELFHLIVDALSRTKG